MTVENIDCLVIGAGVVGLAIARALALGGREVIVLEKEAAIGTGTSSRNSEVIHAGLYYPPGSLKAELCVRGNRMLYAYAAERGVPHRRCGKLIVANSAEQHAELERIHANALACGVTDLSFKSRQETLALEPKLHCVSSLYSPSSGILDSHAYMLSLQGDAEHAQALFAFHSAVVAARVNANGIGVTVDGDSTLEVNARIVINCAGLHAQQVARSITGLAATNVAPAVYAKGNYFSFNGASPFRHLVYPVPEPGGLGVHYSLDLGGQAKFGPDVEWLDDVEVDAIDYQVAAERGDRFYGAIRKYWPGLPDGALQPAYSGVRPKVRVNGELYSDFLISTPSEHGVPGLYNLFGMESPGLTASLAIAEWLERKIK